MASDAPGPNATSAAAVADAYEVCERITAEQARNFYWGIRLLPARKRAALSAVYANARRVDDIGDGELPVPQKLEQLAQARVEMLNPGNYPSDPRLLALDDAARRLPIPLDALGELVDGCEQDVLGHSYPEFDDLVGYCRLVAGSIGRLSLGVFNPRPGADPGRAAVLADSLGVALQLTNILRDIREDLLMGRVYLPEQDLKSFGIAELTLLPDGSLDPQHGRLAELVRFEAARAWGWYDEGLALLPLLDRRSAACCAAMAKIYQELLVRIAREPTLVFNQRTSLPGKVKLAVSARSVIKGRHA
ncbi:MAG: Farnesyl-diphosphate farnesyltransferase [Frankiales bacterium]|nr:Farnesyl-diphosphate farnesyltransferase [Frankiales bacterium]